MKKEHDHYCDDLSNVKSISISTLDGKWYFIDEKQKIAHGIKFCPFCGYRLLPYGYGRE